MGRQSTFRLEHTHLLGHPLDRRSRDSRAHAGEELHDLFWSAGYEKPGSGEVHRRVVVVVHSRQGTHHEVFDQVSHTNGHKALVPGTAPEHQAILHRARRVLPEHRYAIDHRGVHGGMICSVDLTRELPKVPQTSAGRPMRRNTATLDFAAGPAVNSIVSGFDLAMCGPPWSGRRPTIPVAGCA